MKKPKSTTKSRHRVPVNVTLSPRARAILQSAENSSLYVERLVLAYPPPPCETLAQLAQLVRARHPYVVSPRDSTARDGLPVFGGDHPGGPAASWNTRLVMDALGEVHLRSEWAVRRLA